MQWRLADGCGDAADDTRDAAELPNPTASQHAPTSAGCGRTGQQWRRRTGGGAPLAPLWVGGRFLHDIWTLAAPVLLAGRCCTRSCSPCCCGCFWRAALSRLTSAQRRLLLCTPCSYQVAICYPKPTSKPLYDGLVTQCKSLGMPFVSAEELAVSRVGRGARKGASLRAEAPDAVVPAHELVERRRAVASLTLNASFPRRSLPDLPVRRGAGRSIDQVVTSCRPPHPSSHPYNIA